MRVLVCSHAIIAPGLADRDTARPVLRDDAPYTPAPLVVPAPELLPAAERRRAGPVIRLALSAAHQALRDTGFATDDLASVFASADGDGENVHHICEALTKDAPELSPTRFHNSVQNAPSGYWSIAVGSTGPTTTVNSLDTVFAAGLLEAVTIVAVESRPVLLVVFDLPMAPPLRALHPIRDGGAVALLLLPTGASSAAPAVTVEVIASPPAAQSRMQEPALEALRVSNPPMRSLPLLAALARGSTESLLLAFDDRLALRVTIDAAR